MVDILLEPDTLLKQPNTLHMCFEGKLHSYLIFENRAAFDTWLEKMIKQGASLWSTAKAKEIAARVSARKKEEKKQRKGQKRNKTEVTGPVDVVHHTKRESTMAALAPSKLRVAKASPGHAGFLEYEGQRLYFVARAHWLYWFVTSAVSDLDAKGSLFLDHGLQARPEDADPVAWTLRSNNGSSP